MLYRKHAESVRMGVEKHNRCWVLLMNCYGTETGSQMWPGLYKLQHDITIEDRVVQLKYCACQTGNI